MTWRHDDLARDLAGHFRAVKRLVWTDMQMGPAGSPRPDVYTLEPSYTRFTPLAYECKISLSDFRSDVTSGKWQTYLKFAAGVYFAAPAGLISKMDVPASCGLILRGDSGWRAVKKPTLQVVETLPRSAWLKLLFDGVERLRRDPAPRLANNWEQQQRARKLAGAELAELLADRISARHRLEAEIAKTKAAIAEQKVAQQALRDQVEAERRQIEPERAEMLAALELPADASVWAIQRALRRKAAELDRDEQLSAARRAVSHCIETLQRAVPVCATRADGAAE